MSRCEGRSYARNQTIQQTYRGERLLGQLSRRLAHEPRTRCGRFHRSCLNRGCMATPLQT
ncbi:hypothetical protein DBV15_03357 [Temnothorax longispinosus]|uniref:Uncharacterized protein n=1 Tax=Temnothorax longispinosus TaxID=300112 RepID=A0A4S2JN87_9HYME|nr:hypothetical protein DBV15_03357 [Temnothorax longispinosus]